MIETVMTYDEWVREYSRKKKINRKYYAKQKLVGLLMIVISVITPLLTEDATIDLVTIPLGLYLIATREKCLLEIKQKG